MASFHGFGGRVGAWGASRQHDRGQSVEPDIKTFMKKVTREIGGAHNLNERIVGEFVALAVRHRGEETPGEIYAYFQYRLEPQPTEAAKDLLLKFAEQKIAAASVKSDARAEGGSAASSVIAPPFSFDEIESKESGGSSGPVRRDDRVQGVDLAITTFMSTVTREIGGAHNLNERIVGEFVELAVNHRGEETLREIYELFRFGLEPQPTPKAKDLLLKFAEQKVAAASVKSEGGAGGELFLGESNNLVGHFTTEFAKGLAKERKEGPGRLHQKQQAVEEVALEFPHFVTCKGDGKCAYTALVRGALVQLSREPEDRLFEFVTQIIDVIQEPALGLCFQFLENGKEGPFFGGVTQNPDIEQALVVAVQERVVQELEKVKTTGLEHEKRLLKNESDEMFFSDAEALDPETVAMAKLAGVGVEESMGFSERISRIRDGRANQVSAQEINIFAHVFDQSFLDINVSRSKVDMTLYPLVREPVIGAIQDSDQHQLFALFMMDSGHHNLLLR